jgi:hypothetical protein
MGMDYLSPEKRSEGRGDAPRSRFCRALFHREEPSSRIERKISCQHLLGTKENR